MTIRLRTAFFIFLAILSLWFLYANREVLSPFIIAAIFAYVFTPVVDFFNHKVKLPRLVAIIFIYSFFIALIIVSAILVTRRLVSEYSELRLYIDSFQQTTKAQINVLPDEIKPFVTDALSSLQKSKIFSPERLFSFFPQAISRLVSFFIFLFSSFYFLREGKTMIRRILGFIPTDFQPDTEMLLKKINGVLEGYLRGQLFLIFFVSLTLFVALAILGVRFALILALFSGFVEIIPFIGPITAATVAVIVVLVSGVSNFSLTPLVAALIVVAIYFIIRHIQDYFVTPQVMGRITNMHPLVILFAVLVGGHMWGILGLILAVPIAATVKILLEYSLQKMNYQPNFMSKKRLEIKKN